MSRVLGRGAGGLVLTLDLLKGFGPCLWAREWVGGDDVITSATGLAAILGHVAPLWHRFRGGKGVATAAGALLALVPVAGGAALGGYVVFRRVTRVASLASLAGTAIGAVVTAAWLGLRTWPTGMAAATFVIILVRHQSNLRRLAKGEEPRT